MKSFRDDSRCKIVWTWRISRREAVYLLVMALLVAVVWMSQPDYSSMGL